MKKLFLGLLVLSTMAMTAEASDRDSDRGRGNRGRGGHGRGVRDPHDRDAFVGTDQGSGRAVNYNIGHLTRRQGYHQIVFVVRATNYAPIVNTIKVDGSPTVIGRRLNRGTNTFSLYVPRGANQLRISWDHGRGSTTQVYLR